MIAVLGAGPHGRQIAALNPASILYDDYLPGFKSTTIGARDHQYLIGAAMPSVRRDINNKVRGVAHNDGRVIFPYVFLGYDVDLGEHVHVMPFAAIQHGCKIGDFTTICAGAKLGGDVTVESGVLIGMNATIRHGGITIGRNATVGMGAVVVDDVPDNTKVVGNPAKALLKA